MENKKKYALVTGATSGIGLELAKLLAKDGYQLIHVARDEQELLKVSTAFQQDYGVEVINFPQDLAEPGAAKTLYDNILNEGLTVDVLVNNAGMGAYGLFIENDLDRELEIIQLNIVALVSLTKYVLRDMVRKGEGKILNLASIAGKAPGPWQAVYHGTKAFVHFFNEAVNNEIKDTGVTLTSLLPGATDTDFFNKAGMQEAKIVQDGDLADPATVAKDGYDAMMAGKDMVVSGFKNKMQVAMGNVMSDEKQTEMMGKQQEPGTKS